LYPDYKNGNDTVIPKPINHEQAAKRAAWLSRQPEVDELKRQVEDEKKRADFNLENRDDHHKQQADYWRTKCTEYNNQLAAKEKEVEELKWKLNDASVACHKLQAENERLGKKISNLRTANT
jgi:chromosome segregation ATPase